MRLLADENFPLPTVEALRLAGHDVFWVRTDAPGTGDAALLDLAEADADQFPRPGEVRGC